MVDFNTAVQTALTPVVTIPVIAALAISIVAQAYSNARRMKNRLRAQSKRLGEMTAMLLSLAESVYKRSTERQVVKAIEATYDALKDVGFDKLASGEVAFEGVMFGDTPFKPESSRRQPFRDDPFSSFSLADLKEAFGKPRHSDAKTTGVEESGAPAHEDALSREGNGGQKGRRPYHKTAPDLDGAGLGGRSPRAG